MAEIVAVDWEQSLVDDCKQIVFDAELGVFRKWHELGNRVLKDEGYLTREYGDSYSKKLAKKIEISKQSLWRSIQFVKKYPNWQELEKIVSHERLSWREFYSTLLPDKTKIKPLPQETFDIIYADPPWKYDNVGFDRGLAPYPTLATKQICELVPSTPDNAILFLWATNPFLEDAFEVINAWGFKYKTNMVWVKRHKGTGFYVRGQHELLLICQKGNTIPPEPEFRISSIIEAPTTNHSAKPQSVYGIIESMYPNKRYLELFARNKREGWVSWGNEV